MGISERPSDESESVSRRKFLRKAAAIGAGAGIGLTATESILRVQRVNAVTTDQLVKVDTSDTTSDFLNPKVSAGAGITKTVLSPGGYEQLRIAVSSNVLVSPMRQLVWRDSTTTYVRDGITGMVTTYTSSTRDSDALQAALNSLTPGRTWKEKVVVVGGPFGLSVIIFVSSYTILDITGASLQAVAGNQGQGIITIPRPNTSDVEIWGGLIDGNRPPPTSTAPGRHGVFLGSGTSRIKVIGTKFINIFRGYGVYLAGNTSDVLLQDLSFDHTDGAAIASDTSVPGDNVNVRIIRPIITNFSDRARSGLFNGAFNAIHTENNEPNTSSFNRRWLIEGADIDGSGSVEDSHGIYIGQMADARIVGCRTFKPRHNGLFIYSSIYVKAFGNHFESSGQNGVQVDDTGVTPPSDYCSCSRNTLANNIGYAAVERGSAHHNAFCDNLLVGNGAGISATGTMTLVVDNVGTA